MTTRIQFWREINVNGIAGHSVLRTYFVPEEIPDGEALEAAKSEFCTDLGIGSWCDRAHGFDVMRRADDRRTRPREGDCSAFWSEKISCTDCGMAIVSTTH
jgi:hypothetical protein